MRIHTLLAVAVLTALTVGCGDKNAGAGGTQSKGAPVKEEAVRVLRNLNSALEKKDYDQAVTIFQVPPTAKAEDLKKDCARLVELNEISSSGIDILASKGNWGKLAEVFDANRANSIAQRFGVPAGDCYGLKFEQAEAGFYWDGNQFKVIRCDDIGKLK